jgi:hypothetical protein
MAEFLMSSMMTAVFKHEVASGHEKVLPYSVRNQAGTRYEIGLMGRMESPELNIWEKNEGEISTGRAYYI